MNKRTYETPAITELGTVADLTQQKPGFFFDGGQPQGTSTKPPAIPGVTVS
jgi:hypothetical protein